MASDTSPRTRLEQALQELERRWADVGSLPGEALAPGLSEQEMDDLAGEFDVVLNEELRAWWGWRNGLVTYEERPDFSQCWNLLNDATMPSLRAALQFQAQETERFRSELRPLWTKEWLLVVKRDATDLAAILDPSLDHSPILELAPTGSFTVPRVDSLADVLGLWIQAIDEGWVVPDGRPGHWKLWSLPYEVDITGLV